MTDKFGVALIGSGIRQSRTPAMHVAAGRALGLDYRYDLIDTDAFSRMPPLSKLLDKAQADGLAGLNITYPYKIDAMQFVDTLSDAAVRVGAVNTIVFRDGARIGHNTDFLGFSQALQSGLPDAGMDTVLLLGAGGAGGAVAHALVDKGVKDLLIHDISGAAATKLANQAGGSAVMDLTDAAARADGIVNATPMGMAKLPGTAIPLDLIKPRHWVADVVYFPIETALLSGARSKGCQTMNGGGMAVHQAAQAFALFTEQQPDVSVMQRTFDSFDR